VTTAAPTQALPTQALPTQALPARSVLQHMSRLTDSRGLFEHALLDVPRPEHGYCVDDVARALIVVCREEIADTEVLDLCRLYLDFTLSAIQPDGLCHNRMNASGRWTDIPGTGDWWGRALWALGVAAVHAPTALLRRQALRGFHLAARARSADLRAMTFAALGAGELLIRDPQQAAARSLLHDVRPLVMLAPSVAGDPGWIWIEPRLRYGNGSVAEAALLIGAALPDSAAASRGLELLDFLVGIEVTAGRYSVTPVEGRGPTDVGPAFDQQPIEVAALADACARAFEITGDPRWRDEVARAWAWFEGHNDGDVAMFDPVTGAGYDGLHTDGRNLNQGAESTLAMLSTAQHAQRLLPGGVA